jgi:heparosan-N-sulfate-glucuronate 5-epimerase
MWLMARTTTPRRPLAARESADRFSRAASFSLRVGEHFDKRDVRGYYIDMRPKARSPVWNRDEPSLHVVRIQWGLGCYERHLAGEGEQWRAAAIGCAEKLVACQHREGPHAGGFLHATPLSHTFRLPPPWISAMAQGEGASLLVRAFRETDEERFAECARRALLPFGRDSVDGGVRAPLDGEPYFEEYPTQPPSFVLNGGIFAMWGLYDVGLALDEAPAREAFERAVDMLARNLHRWDTGYWSRYDLFPHPAVNVASSFYHDLHINQLHALQRLAPRSQLAETAERWERYAATRRCRARAGARKVLFRLLVPRNQILAARLPWSRLRPA